MKLFNFRKATEDELKATFYPRNLLAQRMAPKPKPAKNYFPEYVKEMPRSFKLSEHEESFDTATHCMPFTDTFVNGYIQELACEISIKNLGSFTDEFGKPRDRIEYRWAGPVQPMASRYDQNRSANFFPHFDGFYNQEFHWDSQWEPKTPPGWSTLYHHPSNRYDLPFHTMSGIIDTDEWHITGPLPFWIKEGFEGVIPAGTPIYQMTFFKRAEWTSEFRDYEAEYIQPLEFSVINQFRDGYKRKYWKPKKFF